MKLIADVLSIMGCVLAVVAVVSALIGVGLTAIGWIALWCVGQVSGRMGDSE